MPTTTPCPNCAAAVGAAMQFCGACGSRVVHYRETEGDPILATLQTALRAQYETVRLLGRGGMGSVYLAREIALDRLVAIKALNRDAESTEGRERFLREARTAARLSHPNIVPLFTFGEADGILYCAMGFVRGISLADRLRREHRLPADHVRRVVSELAAALDYAHREGIVHRDIKPDNVLLEETSGRPMLTDFGIAKSQQRSGESLTRTGVIVGTPQYMSPEQATGEREIDGRSDIYSLGVMAYAMLAGRKPFEAASAQELIAAHVMTEPPPIRMFAPDAPDDLVAAIHRCLAKDPASRWPTGGALKDALDYSTSEEERLPEVIQAMAGQLTARIPFVLAAPLLFWLVQLRNAGTRPLDTDETIFNVVAMPITVAAGALGTLAFRERRRVAASGIGWAACLRAALWPPLWWMLWWPRSLRRPGDVWDRLPAFIRAWRWINSGLYVSYGVIGALVLARLTNSAWFSQHLGVVVPAASERTAEFVVAGTLFAIPVAMMVALQWWLRQNGIALSKAARLFREPTSKTAFWRRPEVNVLLAPEGATAGKAHAQEPRTPADYVAAISTAAAVLTGRERELGNDAVSAARELTSLLEALDAEILLLERDADGTERRQMRRLLEEQLHVLQRFSSRLRDVRSRRERMLTLLRTLWLQVDTFRAQALHDESSSKEFTARIDAVCADISAQRAAMGEVETLVALPGKSGEVPGALARDR